MKHSLNSNISGLLDNNTSDIFAREYNVPYCKSVEILVNDDNIRSYVIPDMDFFRDMFIIGACIRQQNAGDTRLSKNGYKLLTPALLARGFVTFTQNNNTVAEKLPLEYLVHEIGNALDYMQLLIEMGFTTQSSFIEFAGTSSLGLSGVTRAVEITFFYLPKKQCAM